MASICSLFAKSDRSAPDLSPPYDNKRRLTLPGPSSRPETYYADPLALMNERTLLTLGLLLGVGSGKPPEQWLRGAHDFAREKHAEDPMNAIVATVLLGAAAFYAAEREVNPKVKSFYDALIYVSTNLSVGFSDIFAQTDAGKSIGSALMTYGPALAARAFDPPHEQQQRAAEGERSEAALRDIAGKLELILEELRSQRTPTSPHG